VYGPNGFFREFKGSSSDPMIDTFCEYESIAGKKSLTGNVVVKIRNNSTQKITVEIPDNAYKGKTQTKVLNPKAQASIPLDLNKQHGWYDFSVRVKGNTIFEKRYAGRVETGKASITDPLMGRVV